MHQVGKKDYYCIRANGQQNIKINIEEVKPRSWDEFFFFWELTIVRENFAEECKCN